ncbi:urease accessory protein UreH domain-containing protein [Salisediminibacterium selenitireducens]|uniref:Cytochrome c biogenesis protein transmembrane region n=1 Tax=Bacillus selenitireducens (strain ATCC 700615 / DSM 15326 / MLS10) TaxID=439292 RepID=D6XX28_BACIE|nr:sulfite exporter TauE/SafE family protein [Salisediminibacterium selenitireducens]ADI00005.1 cytochrome c biogenesis protein transmembrane region [[Bacillus] selenitireducens MLS10]
MFDYVEAFSQLIRDPFMNLAGAVEHYPILFAFFLGIVGAMAPCQFSGNFSAITLYGSKSIRHDVSWYQAIWFIIGKIAAFSILGLIVVALGQEFQRQLPLFFEPMRKALGPLLLVIGAYMLGVFHMKGFERVFTSWTDRLPDGQKSGPFMLGFLFSLGFCPTMFLLFFGLLMPLSITASSGALLPPLFAIGTSIPFLFVLFIIHFLDIGKINMRKGRRAGLIVQRGAGVLMILLGIFDMLTFW